MAIAKKAAPKKAKVSGGVAISCHKTKKAAQAAAGKAADKVAVVIVKSEAGYCVKKATSIGSKPKKAAVGKPKAAAAPKKKVAAVGKKRKTAKKAAPKRKRA